MHGCKYDRSSKTAQDIVILFRIIKGKVIAYAPKGNPIWEFQE